MIEHRSKGHTSLRDSAILRDLLLALSLLAAATALCAWTGADLALERRFFLAGGGWGLGEANPWRFLYRFGLVPAYLLGSASLGFFIAGFFSERARLYRRGALFCFLLPALGLGLGSAPVKDLWGRPRPHQVRTLGGDRPFRQIWERGEGGRSFPSGHASAAFSLTAPYFVLRPRAPRRARLALLAGLCYGLLTGGARMLQGGHFPTDILWSGGLIYLFGLSLYYLLRLDRCVVPGTKEPSAP